MRGKFITFEGGEGTGKSTQAQHLSSHLQEKGIDVVVTREPGGSPRAEEIRHVLLSGAAESLGPFAEIILFAAARIDHIDKTIEPALQRGAWVLCDRFIDSTRVYQGETGGVEIGTVNALEHIATNGLTPDLTFILDLDAKIGLQRVTIRRQKETSQIADRFEKESLAKHRRIRSEFRKIAKNNPERCHLIQATGDEKQISNDIWSALCKRFAL